MAKTHTALFPTPPLDECKAPIENVFELTPVPSNDGQAVFTNTHPLWHPSGSRGVYGGTLIAQSLSAAMLTVPSTVNMHMPQDPAVITGEGTGNGLFESRIVDSDIDTYFIGTLWRVYNLSPYPSPPPSDQEEPNQKAEEIEVMASLNHSIYLHRPQAVRVDDWMLTEMETPWAGNERGLVVQRIWSTDGILVATCIQEALVRLKQHETPKHML
ncbi:hypothetical protein CNMCM7691_007845 [Aspergillus felis]|uniref:Acyl-CoA thioesterase-like C-terminal domain-containing protein n=1 Tax=Aspergillus felis TaxID=1287682 RepID=A0A8H6V9N4_9EURO|nr:hypothetical protein CNMCM7691_007845 [Aspergillus felis]